MERLKDAVEGADGLRPFRAPSAVRRLGACLALAGALAAGGCAQDAREPAVRLVDGSRAPEAPVALADAGRLIVSTRVRILPAGALDPALLRGCSEAFGRAVLGPDDVVVERVGVGGRSLTFRHPKAQRLLGCDDGAGPREHAGPWCGFAEGKLRAGRVTDPRVDLSCRDRAGRQIAFAWLNPERGARWIAVEAGSYTEVYEVAAGLPVRVTTGIVRPERSSAVLEVTQYAPGGGELSRRSVEVFVAG